MPFNFNWGQKLSCWGKSQLEAANILSKTERKPMTHYSAGNQDEIGKENVTLKVEAIESRYECTNKDAVFLKAELEATRLIQKLNEGSVSSPPGEKPRCKVQNVMTIRDVSLLNITEVPPNCRRFYVWTASLSGSGSVELCGLIEEEGRDEVKFGGVQMRYPVGGLGVKLEFFRMSFDGFGRAQGGYKSCGSFPLDLAAEKKGYLSELNGDFRDLVHARAELTKKVKFQGSPKLPLHVETPENHVRKVVSRSGSGFPKTASCGALNSPARAEKVTPKESSEPGRPIQQTSLRSGESGSYVKKLIAVYESGFATSAQLEAAISSITTADISVQKNAGPSQPIKVDGAARKHASQVVGSDSLCGYSSKDDVFLQAECEAIRMIELLRNCLVSIPEKSFLHGKTDGKDLAITNVTLSSLTEIPGDLRRFYAWTVTSGDGVELCGITEEEGQEMIRFDDVTFHYSAPDHQVELKFYIMSFDEAGEAQGSYEPCVGVTLDLAKLENGYMNEMFGNLNCSVSLRVELVETDPSASNVW